MVLLAALTPARAEAQRPFLAYHASWYDVFATRGDETTLARLPGYLTHVALAFARPDLTYPGGLDLSGTGLQYPYSGAVLKEAIARLKSRHPGIAVLVSVGGANAHGWGRFDEAALARLVGDLGADGVDIDFESENPSCTTVSSRVHCADDALMVEIVRRIRAVLPRPHVVSVAGWSVGAYGEGSFADAPPRSPWRGSLLALLHSPEAGELDLVSIMSYDAGPAYRPAQAFRAYRAAWKGPLALGVAVMPSTQGGPRYTVDYTVATLSEILRDPSGGAMLYALLEVPPGTPGPDNPDYRTLSGLICLTLELDGCDAPMP
ncbi:glycosyl hydrolase family 18 protein [Starkeya koreensis]|uniref:Glycosyl hydrolase family 18 protein n=1 Tax=Ancylobacter koreensis TaxID=266121 RepID=A0ABT0DQ37_9HYPH|nr:glycosyl hydrolase family 18 protein [Ancylobacter koreensis]